MKKLISKKKTFIENILECILWWKPGKYIFSKTTLANTKAIVKAKSRYTIKMAILFRDDKISDQEFIRVAKMITKSSIVLPVFLLHIWKPGEFPILDKNVWRVYKKREKNEIIYKNTKPASWKNYKEYRDFFNNLIKITGLSSRVIDKGLMVMGDKL